MRVQELTAWHVRVPLKKPIRHASHTRTDTDNVIVRCRLASGVTGFGEGVPREYVTGETIDSVLALLRGSDIAGQLEDCRDFAAALALAERLRLAPVPGDERACQGNAARCALELALLDAYGRAFGTPLADATRLLAKGLYEPRSEVRYSGVITSSQGLKLRFAAWKMRLYGFKQVKLKVGIDGQDDVARLGIVRRRLGRADLRVDANEAWPIGAACRRIEELKRFDITAVEQPVAHAEVGGLGEVRRQTRVPIVLDESLCSMVDAERAVAAQSCDLFNLRLSKCGGFIPSLRLAEFARRHGLSCQLGCQVGETAVLSAAGRHFASSVGGLRYVEGSYDRHLVREALATSDITFRWGGKAPALAGPGLGIDVDEAALRRIAVREEVLLDG